MQGFYFVLVPGVIFFKVACVCVCPLHLFIRISPTGLALMRPVEPKSDGDFERETFKLNGMKEKRCKTLRLISNVFFLHFL